MAREAKDSHRHVLPGNILTGPPIFTGGEESDMHKHILVGGDGATSENTGGPNDKHRHTANGQGTSRPINTMKDTQLPDKKANLPERN